jgi:glycosyltransferase involved in cell wall biosynthesis
MNANIFAFDATSNIFAKYISSSILVLTSLHEPFGLVLPEAMSCGVPVVSFDCPYGPADIITDGVDGFLIKNRNIDDFANCLCRLIEDKDLRVQIGKAGIVSSQRYASDIIMPRWIRLYEKMMS